MIGKKLSNTFKSFVENTSGETAVQMALFFSAAIIVGVVAVMPFLDRASEDYAYSKQYGIDTIQTSSTSRSQDSKKRYTIRKSILDAAEE